MPTIRKNISKFLTFLLDSPQLFLREVLENPYKFMLFACLLIVAVGDFLPVIAQEIPDAVTHLQVEVLVFLVFGVFVLAKKNEALLFSQAEQTAEPKKRFRVSPTILSVGALALIFAGALAIRLWDLAILDPYTDENAHLMEATTFLRGEGKSYSRARVLSGLVYLMWRAAAPSNFEQYLFWARIPGVVFGALTIVPLYLVARRISRPVAIVSCLLWAVCPWAIGVSRYIREYTFFPFAILLLFNSYLQFVDIIRNRQRNRWKIALVHIAYIVFFVVAVFVDYKSTLKVGLIVIAAALFWHTCEFLLLRLTLGVTKQNRILSYLVFIIVAAFIAVFSYGSISGVGYNIHPRFLNAFLLSTTTSPTLWWSGYSVVEHIPSLFIFVACIFSGLKRDRQYYVVFSVFMVMILFYYLLFDRYFRPRYCYYVLPFYVIVVSTGICCLFKLLRVFHIRVFRLAAGIILIVFLASVFDYENVMKSVSTVQKVNPNGKRTGYFLPTGEYHQYMKSAQRFLSKRIRDDDVFITTVFQPMLVLEFDVFHEDIYYYPHKSEAPRKRVAEIVKEFDRGWLILDKRRNGKTGHRVFPMRKGKRFTLADKSVTLRFAEDDTFIYQWKLKKKKPKEEE